MCHDQKNIYIRDLKRRQPQGWFSTTDLKTSPDFQVGRTFLIASRPCFHHPTYALTLTSMSLTKSGFKVTEPVPLESLRSPQVPVFNVQVDDNKSPPADILPERDSIASSLSGFNDIALDDEVVPTAKPSKLKPLNLGKPRTPDSSSRPSSKASSISKPAEDAGKARPDSVAFNSIPLDSPVGNGKAHKKTTSNTTIRSYDDEDNSFVRRRASVRASVDGQQKLQEEFARLQKEDNEQRRAEGAIDWGTSARVLLERNTADRFPSN